MVVRVVKDWNYPDNFFRQVPKGDSEWNGVTFTEEKVSECDHLIVLQRPPYDIQVTCPEGSTWLIIQEPPVSYFNFYKKSFPYFDRVFTYHQNIDHANYQSMQPVLPWHVHKSYDELTAINRNHLGHKKDQLVWITSSKNGFPGQKIRMQFKDYLCRNTSINFCLFGRGFQPIADKFDGLFPNKYSLAIENYSCEDYWTEKLADSFLAWCLPFYWGATNISSYFPEKSFISLDLSEPKIAAQTIEDAIRKDEWKKRLSAIEEARSLVLNKYQFFPFISDKINAEKHKNQQKKEYKIPANRFPKSHLVRSSIKYYARRIMNVARI